MFTFSIGPPAKKRTEVALLVLFIRRFHCCQSNSNNGVITSCFCHKTLVTCMQPIFRDWLHACLNSLLWLDNCITFILRVGQYSKFYVNDILLYSDLHRGQRWAQLSEYCSSEFIHEVSRRCPHGKRVGGVALWGCEAVWDVWGIRNSHSFSRSEVQRSSSWLVQISKALYRIRCIHDRKIMMF